LKGRLNIGEQTKAWAHFEAILASPRIEDFYYLADIDAQPCAGLTYQIRDAWRLQPG
jgi:hypothetical protein